MVWLKLHYTQKADTVNVTTNDILTHEALLEYLKEGKKAQATTTQSILKILLKHPEGVLRCCLRDKLNKKGIDIGQPAAQIRDLRNAGVNIPKLKKEKCPIHSKTDTIDKIVSPYIIGNDYARAKYTPSEIAAIRKILNDTDAFTQIKTTTNPEIDHRVPVGRMKTTDESVEKKVDTSNAAEVKEQYQLLTRDTNLYKSRVCEKCVENDTKPNKFLGIVIPKEIGGGETYIEGRNDCSTCPFAHPEGFMSKVKYIDEPISNGNNKEQ